MATYEIGSAGADRFADDGFLLLPAALPDPILQRWRDLAARLERAALAAHAKGDRAHGACVVEDPVGPRLMRQDDILVTDADAVLELLACPAMVAVARELCGRGAVPLQLDIVYKHHHPHPVIKWHQGAPHPRGFPYLNVGIYLDDADGGDGCVRYVPGTQHGLQDIGALEARYGWEIPDVVELPARAGDILVQDMMVLHGSPPKRQAGVRRTIYVEIRPVAGIEESGAQSARWAELRARWMGLVLQRAAPGDWPRAWRDEMPADLGPLEDEVKAIVEREERPIPAVYSAEPVDGPDYPVPSDVHRGPA